MVWGCLGPQGPAVELDPSRHWIFGPNLLDKNIPSLRAYTTNIYTLRCIYVYDRVCISNQIC